LLITFIVTVISRLIISQHMAKIISMSLNEVILDEIDRMTSEMGFSGRSETIRAGVRLLSQAHKDRLKLKGRINAILSVIHHHNKDMSLLMHKYQDIIVTHLHNRLDEEKCLDVFVLKGDANKMRRLAEFFEAEKMVEHVKFYVV